MSLGMGMTFVPLTLTAVHHVGARDSGIGSGVLNTMQQVGGALGLATLCTVAVHFTAEKVASLGTAAKQAAARPASRSTRRRPSSSPLRSTTWRSPRARRTRS